MKKLIPALAMLLVAAALMGTSTYAWFTANTQVTADGMSVKAASSGGLSIATYTGTAGQAESTAVAPISTAFATTATAGWANVAAGSSIKPTSVDESGNWTKASAESANSYAAATGSYALQTEATGYFHKTLWQIKSLNTEASEVLTVKNITVSGAANSAALNQSLRVAIHVGNRAVDANTKAVTWTNDDWFFFAPLTDVTEDEDHQFYYVDYNGGAFTPTAYKYDGTVENLNTADEITAGVAIYNGLTTAPVDVEVYVYYEGEDENCMTNNIPATAVDTLAVSITYGV